MLCLGQEGESSSLRGTELCWQRYSDEREHAGNGEGDETQVLGLAIEVAHAAKKLAQATRWSCLCLGEPRSQVGQEKPARVQIVGCEEVVGLLELDFEIHGGTGRA